MSEKIPVRTRDLYKEVRPSMDDDVLDALVASHLRAAFEAGWRACAFHHAPSTSGDARLDESAERWLEGKEF